MEVKLIAYTPDPERVCAAAAYTSTSGKTPEELVKEMSDDQVAKVLRHVRKAGHHSVIEHASFTFSVRGISRACSHDLVRHRIASYTQESQRYITYKDLKYKMPPKIAENPEMKQEFERVMKTCSDAYNMAIDAGMASEDARFMYPNATLTNICITMNGRELRHFFNLRCCRRAMWEITELADLMLAEARKVAPVIFEDAGPRCVELRHCPEVKPCGQLEEMLKQYKEK